MRLGNLLLGLTLILTIGCSRGTLLKNDDGHGEVCTLLGCEDGFSVTLEAMDSELPMGTYDVWLEVNGTARHCQIISAGPTPTQTGDCEDLNWTHIDGKRLMGSITFKTFTTDVTALRITFMKDGTMIATRDLRPVYQFSYPNGERCGGACKAAPRERIPVDL